MPDIVIDGQSFDEDCQHALKLMKGYGGRMELDDMCRSKYATSFGHLMFTGAISHPAAGESTFRPLGTRILREVEGQGT